MKTQIFGPDYSIVLYFLQQIDAPAIRFFSHKPAKHLDAFTQALSDTHAAIFYAQDRLVN